MPERDVGGVISAETGPTYGHSMIMAFTARQIENVANDHLFVSIVRPHSVGRMNSLIVETVDIDRVRAVTSNLAIVDIPRDRADQAEILVLEVTSERSRK